ncbi:esterase family protein [Echinicola sp. CAU 1574]|uniref:Esterase family protein n=1 Tax=Echinicola arenosa TaxID=2774144 RepID=A0ABR9AKU9_9BACT|nr:alpha/beta hydrolase-fold protein [Echinicola arenosa]MBD8489431.1 esterase family protein [Echinicola arenosa]
MKTALLTGIFTAMGLVISSLKAREKEMVEEAPYGFDKVMGGPRGEISTMKYYSNATNSIRKALVYTPPGYDEKMRYPVLYLLHGIRGDEYAWFINGQANIILDNLINQGKAKPMILIFPNGRAMKNDRPLGNLFDKEKLAAFDIFKEDLLENLIYAVESKFNVIPDSYHRAIAGVCMGAGQSLNIGLGNQRLFSWVGAFTSAPNFNFTKAAKWTLLNLRMNLIWISCGEKDKCKRLIDAISEELLANQIDHIYGFGKGGYGYHTWKNDLYWFAQLLFKDQYRFQ